MSSTDDQYSPPHVRMGVEDEHAMKFSPDAAGGVECGVEALL